MTRSSWMQSMCIAAAAALALAAAPAAAQSGTVRGRVVDTRTGEAVANAAVHVGDERVSAIADAQGRFEVKHVARGTRAVWADAPGYSAAMGAVEVGATPVEVTVEMESDPVRLAAVVAVVNRFERRVRGYPQTVRVLRQSDIASSTASTVRELVQMRTGLRSASCRPNTTYAGGDCLLSRGQAVAPVVYIDEVRWMGGLDMLTLYSPWEVSRIEVYSSGQQIRVYTRWFMDWAAERAYRPWPLHV